MKLPKQRSHKIEKEYPLSKLEDFKDHRRLKVFYTKGCKCVSCEREGTKLAVTFYKKDNSRHIDLYTEDFILMTIDHIIPKSLGGNNHIDNLQPMCEPCNTKKGNTL